MSLAIVELLLDGLEIVVLTAYMIATFLVSTTREAATRLEVDDDRDDAKNRQMKSPNLSQNCC